MSNPILEKPLFHVHLSGQIDSVSPVGEKQKIILSDIRFLNEHSQTRPIRVQLYSQTPLPYVSVGDNITVSANLYPIFKKDLTPNHREQTLYFQNIGASGIAHKILSHQKSDSLDFIRQLQQKITNRINSVLSPDTARFATPLLTGDQSSVTLDLYSKLRAGGVTHLLSVSGFHLGLLAFFTFILARVLFAFCPLLLEHIPLNKAAALFSLITTLGYLIISGSHIPAFRSFIMLAFVLTAILFNRNALSFRSLSIAAIILLIWRPEFVFNIGFQLSFMATLILITLYQPLYRYLFPTVHISLLKRIIRYLIGYFLLSFLINLATLPLTLYHFHQLAPYGILGNILAGTIFSFFIMPCLFISLIFMIFGLDFLFLKTAALGIQFIIAICDTLYHLPFSLIPIPSFSANALLIILSGIWSVCLMRTRLRLLGFIFIFWGILSAIITIPSQPTPIQQNLTEKDDWIIHTP